jgi:hypothetical protein
MQPNALSPSYLAAHPTAWLPAYGRGDGSTLLGMWVELQRRIVTQTYANGFHIVSIMCLAGTGLAVLLSTGRPKAHDDHDFTHVAEA